MLSDGGEHGGGHKSGAGSCPARCLPTRSDLILTNYPVMGTVEPLSSATGLRVNLQVHVVVIQPAVKGGTLFRPRALS